jgi:hypothetical protein
MAMKGKEFITRSDVIKEMARITGQSINSVDGSTIDPNHFGKEKWFLTDFIVRNGIIFWRKKDEPITPMVNYDSEGKEKARQYVFKNVGNIINPMIAVTANTGGDIKVILSKNPNAIIHNIEINRGILDEYLKNDVNKTKTTSHNMDVFEFFKKYPKYHFDIIWLDCYCFVQKSMAETLKLINDGWMADELSITLKHTKNPRNGDKFSCELREKYKLSSEPQKVALDDLLTNYVYLGRMSYESSKVGSKGRMVVLKYRLRDEN